jgi:hypothetical protein
MAPIPPTTAPAAAASVAQLSLSLPAMIPPAINSTPVASLLLA